MVCRLCVLEFNGRTNSDGTRQISPRCKISPTSTLSVLLNRSGYTTSGDTGYGDKGYSITLNDGVANPDIHLYQSLSYTLNGSGQLTGTWKTDGALTSGGPTRDLPLSQFFGENPNGVWTLFVSDQAIGNRAKLNSWTIEGIGAVPEPEWTPTAVASVSLISALLLRAAGSRIAPTARPSFAVGWF